MAPAPLLMINVEPLEDAVMMRVIGEVDLSNADQLRARLDEVRETRTPMLLDLSAVGFIDSSGLHVLLETARVADAQAWAWHIVGVSGPVARLFEVTAASGKLPMTAPYDGDGSHPTDARSLRGESA